MPRPKTKEELVLASKENYENLNRFISQLSEDELQTPFDFSLILFIQSFLLEYNIE